MDANRHHKAAWDRLVEPRPECAEAVPGAEIGPRPYPTPLAAGAMAMPFALRPGLRGIWSHPLPYMRPWPLTRFLCRLIVTVARRFVLEVHGVEHVAPAADPFLLVANHSQRFEAVLFPTTLIHRRHGKLIHFLFDWPILLIPGMPMLLRRSGGIIVAGKRARFGWLNFLKPLFHNPEPAFKRAVERLAAGHSVGLFPEGTMNRDPRRLLPGRTGAAKLALRAGVPVVPAGIRFPRHDTSRPIPDRAPMIIEIGPPIDPSQARSGVATEEQAVRVLHSSIMREIARLSGKQWPPQAE